MKCLLFPLLKVICAQLVSQTSLSELLCTLVLLTKGGSSLLICIEINSASIILTIKSAEPYCVYTDSDKSLKLYAVRVDLAFSFQSPPPLF